MQSYIGLDIHKKFVVGCIMNQQGKIIFEYKFKNDPHSLDVFLLNASKDSKIALESCNGWEYIYDYLTDAGYCVELANPTQILLIAKSRKKTDSNDAKILADLLRTNMLPTCYAAPSDIREQRQVVRHRRSLTDLQTEIKNKIHAILLRNGIEHGFPSIFTDKGKAFLCSIDLPGYDRQQLDDYIELLNHLKKKISETTEASEDYVRHNPHARLLMTIPGISYYSALMIAAELGDIRRFNNAKQVASYAGLNPSVRQSGMSCHIGHISKQGNKNLRWILVQIAHIIVQRDNRFATFFTRIANQRSRNIAYVAVARKLMTVIYAMLRNNAPYFALQKAKAT